MRRERAKRVDYRSEPFVPFLFRAELAIHEADVARQGELLDGDVRDALRWMLGVLAAEDTIARLQTGLIGMEGQWLVRRDVKPCDLIVSRIAFNWQTQSASSWVPANDDLAGVLREVLKSLDVWQIKAIW